MTYYDTNYKEIGEICEKTIKKYAEISRVDWEVFNTENNTNRPASWVRIKIILSLFKKGYKYVLWMDSDSLFVDYSRNITNEIKNDKNLYMVRHNINRQKVPNLGVFLIRNCKWSKELLGKMWSMEKYINHKWWENAAFLKLLGYNSLLEEGEDKFDDFFLKRIKWLDLSWNSLPLLVKSLRPIINHYPGISYCKRIKYMKMDLSRSV